MMPKLHGEHAQKGWTDRQTDRQTDRHHLTVVKQDFVAAKNVVSIWALYEFHPT